MRGIRSVVVKTALLTAALLPMMAAVSPPDSGKAPRDANASIAIAQPLATLDGAPIVAVPRRDPSDPTVSETGMLLLVGSSLFGLAALVRRAT